MGDSVIASTEFCLALFLIYPYASSLFGDTLYLVPVFCNFLQISLCNKKLVYKRGCKLFVLLILGKPMAQLKIAWSVTTTGVNAVISVIAATIVYVALRPVLIKANLFFKIGKEK